MRPLGCLSSALLLLSLAGPALAQEAVESPLQISPSGEAYLDAVGRSRINSDVAYYDPNAPVPPLETEAQPEPEAETAPNADIELGEGSGNVFALISAIVLVGLFMLLIRYGGGISVALQSDSDNPEVKRKKVVAATKTITADPRDLREILQMADKRAALVALAQNALRLTVVANGLLLQQSWTGRDALRRLPREQNHLDALRRLWRASEAVQFGDRDVTEPEFDRYVAEITPLYREVSG